MTNTYCSFSADKRNDLVTDPWIANSLMHKAIRRGDILTAERSALSFHALRGSAIWRRLMIIGCEDVGVGSIAAVTETIDICTNIARRKSLGGNSEAIRNVMRLLCSAPKDRSTDHLVAAVDKHPSLEGARRKMASMSDDERLEISRDHELPLPVRAAAIVYASGLGRDRKYLGGNLHALAASYHSLGAQQNVVEASILAGRRTNETIAVLIPLLELSQVDATHSIECVQLPDPAMAQGIPLYAFDKHTRIGRQAFELFARENSDIRKLLERFAAGRSGREAVGMAAFHAEAAIINPRLVWPQSRPIESIGVESDLFSAGIQRDGHQVIIQAIRDNLDHLNDLRAHIYERSTARA
jgi:hypothetical protein